MLTDADTAKTPTLLLLAPLPSVLMLNVPAALTTAGSSIDIYSLILIKFKEVSS
jgi:hypothetical protein